MEFRKLLADEIEVRVQSVTKNGNGVTLLLYKDSRCDMRLLDETVGPLNWKRQHCRENANCIVSIWDSEKAQWISKEDTGTESNTEAEKGLASDSFKRACFNWGIGRELYTSPFIFLNSKVVNIENGKCFEKFKVSRIEYDKDSISFLEIINAKSKAVVYAWGMPKAMKYDRSQQEVEKDLDLKINTIAKATNTEFKTILSKLIERANISKPLDQFNVDDFLACEQQAIISIRKIEASK